MRVLRNLLIVCGAFYLSIWVLLLLEWLWSFVSNNLRFAGDLQVMLLMPVVMAVPTMVVATAVGVMTVLAVDAKYPSRWALLPAALFLERHVFAHRSWVIGPTTADYVDIAVEAALPVIACVVGAVICEGRRRDVRSKEID